MSASNPEAIECVRLDAAPGRALGRAHGEQLRERIAGLYAIRLELMREKTDLSAEADILRLAGAHLPVLEAFDALLYQELLGIAEGSGLRPEQIVVVNHYTDLRDLGLKDLRALDDGGCSTVYVPASEDAGPLLGQTWDMHGSAADYVLLLDVGEGESRTVLFTIAGCLGMTGFSARGLGMTINNLNSVDAQIGVVWPALVRRCLREPSAAKARDVVMEAKVGSGHHYIVADPSEVYGITTSGTKKKLVQSGSSAHLHTNHTTDDEMALTCRIPDGSTTKRRLSSLKGLASDGLPKTARGLYDAFSRVVLEPADRVTKPHAVATCGAFVMDLSGGEVLACQGPPSQKEPLSIQLRKAVR